MGKHYCHQRVKDYGKSGNGSRQSGIWVLDQMTRWQAVNWDYYGRLQKAQMDVTELTPDLGFRI